MEPFGIKETLLATTLSSVLAIRAYKRKSLTFAGAVSAFSVSFLLAGTGTIFILRTRMMLGYSKLET